MLRRCDRFISSSRRGVLKFIIIARRVRETRQHEFRDARESAILTRPAQEKSGRESKSKAPIMGLLMGLLASAVLISRKEEKEVNSVTKAEER